MSIYWYDLYQLDSDYEEDVECENVLIGPPPSNLQDWDDICSIWFSAP